MINFVASLMTGSGMIGGYEDGTASAIGTPPNCTLTSCPSSTSVPEPASALLLPLSMLMVFLLRGFRARTAAASRSIAK
jgi:hypothetical protein